jgi:hypothetical protein
MNILKGIKTQQENDNPSKEWAADLHRHLFKEDIKVANKHMKR